MSSKKNSHEYYKRRTQQRQEKQIGIWFREEEIDELEQYRMTGEPMQHLIKRLLFR